MGIVLSEKRDGLAHGHLSEGWGKTDWHTGTCPGDGEKNGLGCRPRLREKIREGEGNLHGAGFGGEDRVEVCGVAGGGHAGSAGAWLGTAGAAAAKH